MRPSRIYGISGGAGLSCPAKGSGDRKEALTVKEALTGFDGAPAAGAQGTAKRRPVAALSGGVDSAVAAVLAVRAGHAPIGITMRLWSAGEAAPSQKARQCCGPSAYEDARRAAGIAGMPHYIVNFERAFHHAVVDYFCAEYLAGRTPNPCVACNNLIKFGALLDFAQALGAGSLITGHYARVQSDSSGPRLLRARDRTKDQSYMLAGLRPAQLAAMIVPLGEYSKDDTRRLAHEFGLALADKPDSMDLCFVDGDYRTFIERRFPDSVAPGPVLTTDGEVVGRHDGLLGFTVGQRKGIPSSALGDGPWYVVRTDAQRNAVVVGRKEVLARDSVTCSAPNVIRPQLFNAGCTRGLAQCRYRAKAVPARVQCSAGERLCVEFAQPIPVVTPGQLLVLYDDADEEVIASGVIDS